MSGWLVKEYPGENQKNPKIIDLAQHGSFREATIDLFGRAARWQQEYPETRKITAPKNDKDQSDVAICWEHGKILFVLAAERIEA